MVVELVVVAVDVRHDRVARLAVVIALREVGRHDEAVLVHDADRAQFDVVDEGAVLVLGAGALEGEHRIGPGGRDVQGDLLPARTPDPESAGIAWTRLPSK